MGTINFSGLASGIDTTSLITQLMALERRPEDLINNQKSDYQNKISAYNQLSSALTNLQKFAAGINTPSGLDSMKTSVIDATVLTVSAGSGAVAGTHTVEVTTLAKYQRQVSDSGFASATDLNFKTGTFTISGGSADPIQVKIKEGDNSLNGMAAAINASGANMTASVVNDGSANPYRLVINGKDSNNYTLDLAGLSVAPVAPTGVAYNNPVFSTGTVGYQSGSPAVFSIDGVSMTRTTNSVSDALSGVTINLQKGGGSSTSFTVDNDVDGVTAKITSFVSSYNSVVSLMKQFTAYDSTTKKASILSGDSTVRSMQSQLQSIISSVVGTGSGTVNTLPDIGITTNYQDGTLSVDATKLSTALTSNFSAVSDLFTHNSATSGLTIDQYGIAEQLNQSIGQLTHAYVGDGNSDNGLIATGIKGFNDRINDFTKQVTDMEARITKKQLAMQKQFAAMEKMISSLQTQGNQITQMFNSINPSK